MGVIYPVVNDNLGGVPLFGHPLEDPALIRLGDGVDGDFGGVHIDSRIRDSGYRILKIN
jgi:hypothetical protein